MESILEWENPVPFVTIENGKLQINDVAAILLKQIHQPVVAVAVSGTYKSGKSYLMNRLANNGRGFKAIQGTETESKGIWIWCLKHRIQKDTALILLNVQGLNYEQKNNRTESMLLDTLNVVLCSTFVYNVIGKIEQSTIDILYFIVALIKKFSLKNSDGQELTNPDDIWNNFPSFILTIRDFCLSLKKDGKKITSDEYLEDVLTTKKDELEPSFNQPQKMIKNAFKDRHCFTFPHPLLDMDDVNELNKMSDDKLAPNFLNQCEKFCEFLYENSSIKNLGSDNNTGESFLALAEETIEKLNSENICLDPILIMTEKRNEEIKTKCFQIYKEEMDRLQFPVPEKDLEDNHNLAMLKAMTYFQEHNGADGNQKFLEDIEETIEDEFNDIIKLNAKVCSEKYQKMLDDLYRVHLADKINSLCRSGGYKEYQEILNKILEEYDKETTNDSMANDVKTEFLCKRKVEMDSIRMADEAMTQMNKEREEREKKDSANKKQLEVEDDQNKLKKDQTRKRKSDKELVETYESILNDKRKEKVKLQREGRMKEIENLDRDIKSTEKILERYKKRQKKEKTLYLGIIGTAFLCGSCVAGLVFFGKYFPNQWKWGFIGSSAIISLALALGAKLLKFVD